MTDGELDSLYGLQCRVQGMPGLHAITGWESRSGRVFLKTFMPIYHTLGNVMPYQSRNVVDMENVDIHYNLPRIWA